ncbi:MAG: hypothetical protein QOF93_1707 [Verrucomicrobiota bacterium]
MINVAMGQNDGFRRRARTETRFGGGKNLTNSTGKTGINDDPFAAGTAKKIDIRKTHRQPADIGRDSSD